MTQNETERRIKPLPAGSKLELYLKGKNAGKYAVFGMEGMQNSLKRFACQKLYLINPPLYESPTKTIWSVYDREDKALDSANAPWRTARVYVTELILTPEQIIR